MSLPQTKRKVMGRIDLAAEDSHQRNTTPNHLQRQHKPGLATSSTTPVRSSRPLSATPAAPAAVAKTPGSTRARVDLSSFSTANGRAPSASPFAASPSASASAPVTPRIGAGPTTVLHAGPSAGVSLRSPSPSRPSPRPALSPAVSSGNITPRSAARVRARQPSITSSSAEPAPSISIPHSHSVASLPSSGRSSPVRPAYLGHVRANTHAVIPNAASLRGGPSAQRLTPTVPAHSHYRPGSPVRASSPDSHSTISTSSQSDASWHPARRGGTASEGMTRPALTPIQVYDAQPHVRRASSGYSAPAPMEPIKSTSGSAPGTSFPTGARLLRPYDGSSAPTTAAHHSPPRSTAGLSPPSVSPQKQHTRVFPASSAALLSPTSEVSPSEPLEYAQLRVERKIADLEITNKSLLAINSGLEVTKHRQAREIRDLKRRLRERGRGGPVIGPGTSSEEEFHDAEVYSDDEDESGGSEDGLLSTDADADADAGPREDPELAAAHTRCKSLIDDMLQKAREAITWQYVHDESKSKVLSLGEVKEREQEEEEQDEEQGDVSIATTETSVAATEVGGRFDGDGGDVDGDGDSHGDSDDDSRTVDARPVAGGDTSDMHTLEAFSNDVETLDRPHARDPDVSID